MVDIDSLRDALGDAYLIERELAGGGMSRVFVALDRRLERRVVIKVLPESLGAHLSLSRFRREILLAASLQHPHIVGVISAGECAGLPYFIMPYVDGESLAERLKRVGPLESRDAIGILKDVARALAFAHGRGIVHRDIKPSNVMVTAGSAMLTDFGVAKAIATAQQGTDPGSDAAPAARLTELTGTGTSLGTALYMAPEQVAADPDIDHRADIYAFGVTAYEMLTGAPPFADLQPRAMLVARLTQRAPSIRATRRLVPVRLERLIMKCLEVEPTLRPRDATEVLRELDAIDAGSTMGWGTQLLHIVPMTRRGWGWAFALLLLVAAGVAFVRSRAPRNVNPVVVHGIRPLGAPTQVTLAIAPFVPLSDARADTLLARELVAELAGRISKSPRFRLLAPTRVAAMMSKVGAGAELGSALKATMVLEGTVQRDSGHIRVTASLVNVSDGVMRWADVFEVDARELTQVQASITSGVLQTVEAEPVR